MGDGEDTIPSIVEYGMRLIATRISQSLPGLDEVSIHEEDYREPVLGNGSRWTVTVNYCVRRDELGTVVKLSGAPDILEVVL